MGNQVSSPAKNAVGDGDTIDYDNDKSRFKSFPGSAILEKTFCGSIDTTDPAEYHDVGLASRILKRAEIMCVSSPISSTNTDDDGNENNSLRSFISQSELGSPNTKLTTASKSEMSASHRPIHPSSAMFARALVSEVTDNPKTMKPADMALREKKLLKAQDAATRSTSSSKPVSSSSGPSRPVGTPGGIGPPNVLGSLAFACTGDEAAANVCSSDNDVHIRHAAMAPQSFGPFGGGNSNNNSAGDNRATSSAGSNTPPPSPYQVTIALSLSRRHSGIGHPDTITRQTAFDFNELQDRQYKYVSSTDQYGWRAGGGEPGGKGFIHSSNSDLSDPGSAVAGGIPSKIPQQQQHEKIGSPDTVYLPIIHIDCPNSDAVDGVITALASGEIFIPRMMILPEALSVSGGGSPPDLIVRFGCERNDDIPPDDWPNWCLEFMHNQLYEYFYNYGARWMRRPFNITIAKSVRWKTVKHMNRYFAHAEHVIESWRERGPQFLDPQLSYIDGGATPEEVAKPHGIYLFRTGSVNGGITTPTNYFSPNFDPPYTTKMTRSLLLAVLGKSWDKKRREWTSEQMPRLVEPATLMAAACGCTDPNAGGFLAKEVTTTSGSNNTNHANNNSNIHSNHQVGAGTISSSSFPVSPKKINNGRIITEDSPPRSKSAGNSHLQRGENQQHHQQIAPMTHSEVEFSYGTNDEHGDENRRRMSTSAEQHHQGDDSNNRLINPIEDSDSNTHQSEEKKSDEPVQAFLTSTKKFDKSRQNHNNMKYNPNNSILTDDDVPLSVAASGYETSIAASGTTVLRTNTTRKARTLPDQSENEKVLYSDEDWDRSGLTPRTLENAINNIKFDDGDKEDAFANSSVASSDHVVEKVRSPSWSTRRKSKKATNASSTDESSSILSNLAEADNSALDNNKNLGDSRAAASNEKAISSNVSSVSSSTIDDVEDDESNHRFDNVTGNQGRTPKDALKREQQRQAALIAKVRTVTDNSNDSVRNQNQGTYSKSHRPRGNNTANSAVAYSMPSSFKVGNMTIGSAGVEQTFSGTSLEYSTDGSSAFFMNDQGSTNSLIGQSLLRQTDGHSSLGPVLSKTGSSYDSDSLLRAKNPNTLPRGKSDRAGIPLSKTSSSNDDSDSLLRDSFKRDGRGNELNASSSGDDDSILRDDMRSLSKEKQQQKSIPPTSRSSSKPIVLKTPIVKPQTGKLADKKREETDSSVYISLQESSSYTTAASVIPTDEELYTVGWAKALDPASGNYYYFTLDRTRTVWENPLLHNDGNSSAWGDGTASEVTTSSVGMPGTTQRSVRTSQPNGRFDP